jgi:TRAP-type transport system small permease protein
MEIDQSLGLKRDNTFDAVILYTATALFALTIVLTILQVAVRTLGIGGLHWTEPVARFILIIGTYFGAAVATRNREHIKIDLVLERLTEDRPNVRRGLNALVAIAVVLFVVVALRSTIGATIANWTTSIGGAALITSGMIYLGISVGLGLMLVYELINLRESVLNFLGNEGDDAVRQGDADQGDDATREEGR